MHGAGNDFVIVDGVTRAIKLTTSQIQMISDRKRGIGCDQLLIVRPPDDPNADFRYEVFNTDGSRSGQCGNGARCISSFLYQKRLCKHRKLTLQTDGASVVTIPKKDGQILVGLTTPEFTPSKIPFKAAKPSPTYNLEVGNKTLSIGALSMGNPHAILIVDDCKKAPVTSLGAVIGTHEMFPEKVNVNFMEILGRDEINLRVFERGVGETEACGSGACAAVVHGISIGLLDSRVAVNLPGGKLSVSWKEKRNRVWLSGPSTFVFDAEIKID